MKRVLHLYELSPGGCKIVFVIAIDPIPNVPGLYNFLLFTKAGSIERRICTPVQLKLAFDPRDAEFDVSLIPNEKSFPTNSHYSLRIWIRRSLLSSTDQHDISTSNPPNLVYRHRIFTHEEFYIARFPLDLNTSQASISGGGDANQKPTADPTSTAGKSKSKPTKQQSVPSPLSDSKPPKDTNANLTSSQPAVLAVPEDISDYVHVLSAKVGGVALKYTVTIAPVQPNAADTFEYLLSLEYEAGGITRFLVRNYDLRITCPLNTLGFTVFTTFQRKTTTGSIHHLSFWICSPQSQAQSGTQPSSMSLYSAPNEIENEGGGGVNGICQRLWRTDSFLVTSPVLPLPSSSSDTPPPQAPEGMLLASKHVKSPMSVHFGGDGDESHLGRGSVINPFDDGGNGVGLEAAELDTVDHEGWDIPSSIYSQSGHAHSGAFGPQAEEDDEEEGAALIQKTS